MKAVIYDGELRFVTGHPLPDPLPGEALVRVRVAGICRTDIEITRGYMGFSGVLGHEFVGVVEDVNSADRSLVGRRVTGEINIPCGGCSYCLSGLGRHCPDRAVLGIRGKDGAMAERMTLPLRNLHVVPDNVPDEEAVFAEPLAAAFEIAEQVHIAPGAKALVLGDGKLGILCALVLDLLGSVVTLAGKHESKLKVAGARGISTVALSDLSAGRRYDLVVDATGSPGGLALSISFVKPRGTVVLKTTTASGAEVNLSPLVVNEINLVGSRCGPFGPALRALSAGRIQVGDMVTGLYGFDKAAEAFRVALARESLKVLLDFRA